MERSDEEIVHCINSCWPEFPFGINDIRRPTGDKFREILLRFLKTFISGNYQLPNWNVGEFTKSPEMYQQLEGTVSLYREIHSVLKLLNYHSLHYGDLVHPTANILREVCAVLVNFLAYYESTEYVLEETENEVINMKQQKILGEKQLLEKRKYFEKCKQQEEEKKIQDSELRQIILNHKERARNLENTICKLQSEIDDSTKRESASKQKLEQLMVSIKQVEGERDKAAEAVVPDPEELEQELQQCNSELEVQKEALSSLKERLPVLEQQLQERISQLEMLTDISQRITELKTKESKIRTEFQAADAELKRLEKEEEILKDLLVKETSVVESKKRMLEQSIQRTDKLRNETEKTRTELKQALTDDNFRKAQQEQLAKDIEKEISNLMKELESGQKALDEGVATSKAMDEKFKRDMKTLEERGMQTFREVQQLLDDYLLPLKQIH